MRTLFVNLQYVVLVALIVAQCVIGADWYLGQFLYLGCNALSVVRCFVLRRPVADKIKDCCCLAITIGLIGFRFLGV